MNIISLTTEQKNKVLQHCVESGLHMDNLSAMEITQLLYPNSKDIIETFLGMFVQKTMSLVDINDKTFFVLPDNISMLFGITDEPYSSISENELFLPITNSNHGCTKSDVYWSEQYLLFTKESTFKNWQYYAGLEYAENVEIINVDGRFWALYDAQSDDRIQDIIDLQLEEN